MTGTPAHDYFERTDEARYAALSQPRRPRFAHPVPELPEDRVPLDHAALRRLCPDMTDNQIDRAYLSGVGGSGLPRKPPRWQVESAAVALGCDPSDLINDGTKREEPTMPKASKPDTTRTCSCGYSTSWAPAFGRHLQANPDHKQTDGPPMARPRKAAPAMKTCECGREGFGTGFASHQRGCEVHKAAVAAAEEEGRCTADCAEEPCEGHDPEHSAEVAGCDLPCSVDPCDGTDCTRDDEESSSIATDPEGWPWDEFPCRECPSWELVGESAFHRCALTEPFTVENCLAERRRAELTAAKSDVAPLTAADHADAADALAFVVTAFRDGRVSLPPRRQLADPWMNRTITELENVKRNMSRELIDTHLRLITSELQAGLALTNPSLVCSLQDRIERVQELVKEVAR